LANYVEDGEELTTVVEEGEQKDKVIKRFLSNEKKTEIEVVFLNL
jgi:hypothetical protein